ncbi:uncharacterized protein (DUF924 family) [Devosia sp. UYZn731]|uniref:DUF924 family protein n=1 Tax=Devosia sp. UYZn731 TaxID=3156345 RepID=UPI00339989AA
MRTAADIIAFWFEQHGPDDWFGGKAEFDAEIAEGFAQTHAHVAKGEAWQWRATGVGRLAEIIVLDQFSRQLFRKRPEAFAQDKMALVLAQEAIAQGADEVVSPVQRPFFYLPFMHAESLPVQDEGLKLYSALGDADQLGFMQKHHDCIAQFGRFPVRNAALGRASTPEEVDYLAQIGDRSF